MIKFQRASISLLIFFVVYWSLIISLTIFFAVLGVAVFFFLTNGNALNFDWLAQGISAVRKGVSAGTVLGIGIWGKAKMEENKRKKSE
ncbi:MULTISPECIES: hypothetical protein [Edwardsiella]|uniref:Uncharacterized protein n=3 Tax=Edwardsiella TaxID=635 RepID=A0A076LU74_9GAMM|nr:MULTISPECIES: hypothetical protein [Edwardsiella]AIJ09119.1 Hypothetical protein ETEE_2686 [Edwardsiella anguillarum ET080813]AKR77060.1 hypothetical protein AAZ33_04340 [Edwardsiella sp. LADL05-105]ELV7529454.1 hypothetical protein [Edwardsiella ictaluri]KAB0585231.1 hypothetical protein F7P84_19995 [Edwardsiella anguillarum]KMQ73798.1 hypothetical protein ABY58_17160 [Edwardsiella ictaluri]